MIPTPLTIEERTRLCDALRGRQEIDVQVIKIEGQTKVVRAVLLGRAVIIKSWPVVSLFDDVKIWLRLSRAHRQVRGAERLMRLNVATAEPLALGVSGDHNGSYMRLAVRALPGKTVLQHLADADLSPRQQHALARRIALDMAALLRAGYYNRDHKPSNLIVTSADAADPRVAVIDTVAIRRAGDVGAIRMLASLYIEPLGCGVPPRRALAFRVVRTLANEGLGKPYQQLWMYAGNVIRNHGDARPKVDPLGSAQPTTGR